MERNASAKIRQGTLVIARLWFWQETPKGLQQMNRADQQAAMEDGGDFRAMNSFIGSSNAFSRGM